MRDFLARAQAGFETVKVGEKYRAEALRFLEQWLSEEQFAAYVPQIQYMIENQAWDYLIDCFYQIIPFGTGGRRGEVGIGPNRINPWTIRSSAQGHSQYLIKRWGEEAKRRGVVLAWDVRQFFGNKYMNPDLPNPVLNLTGDVLARAAAEVYAANGVKVYMFDGPRTTPELSFAVRYLQAVGGDVFSASHNPPEHNGKKVYDETGGQLVPPFDEELVKEVTENVKEILAIPFNELETKELVKVLGEEIDDEYVKAASALTLSKNRDVKIAYTPLHGCGSSSVLKVLQKLQFDVHADPETSNPSGKFEHVTFHIPNPEVQQSFDVPLKFAEEIKADILLNSDPDADRIGVMVKHKNQWRFLNGNEMAALLAQYAIEKRKDQIGHQGVIIKTEVTTNLLREIALKNNVHLIGGLLVGFKYVGVEMNKLEKEGKIDMLVFGGEESHGYIAGNYTRDKDAVVAAIWLSELAGELKNAGRTLVDKLEEIYSTYGYFGNYLTEIRLPGAEGKTQIDLIQDQLRSAPPEKMGDFEVIQIEDFWNRKPIVSETDKSSKNMLAFHFKPVKGTLSIKVTVRPSGTEPKSKMYIEIGSSPFPIQEFSVQKELVLSLIKQLERAFMKYCYKLIGVDFPDRGFLLFWQLPLNDKLKYFEIEPDILKLKEIENKDERSSKLAVLLAFLGADPVQKADAAFKEAYGSGIRDYLEIA